MNNVKVIWTIFRPFVVLSKLRPRLYKEVNVSGPEVQAFNFIRYKKMSQPC
jgi:hypothetical protein